MAREIASLIEIFKGIVIYDSSVLFKGLVIGQCLQYFVRLLDLFFVKL